MSKRKSVMELLIVTSNIKDSENVVSIVQTYSPFNLLFQSYGSRENNDIVWNFDIIEQRTIIALIPIEKTKEILSQLEASLNLKDKHQGIAFTLPLDSATRHIAEKIKGENA